MLGALLGVSGLRGLFQSGLDEGVVAVRVGLGARVLVVSLLVSCVGLFGQGAVLAASGPVGGPGSGGSGGENGLPGSGSDGGESGVFDPSVLPVGWLVGQHSGRCVVADDASVGAVWELFDCKGAGQQTNQLVLATNDGQLQVFAGGAARCASVVGTGRVRSAVCDDSKAEQLWDIDAHGHVKNRASGLCMDAQGNKRDNWTPVIAYRCWNRDGGSNQNFDFITRMTGAASPDGLPLRNPSTGLCLEGPKSVGAFHAGLRVESCAESKDQAWVYRGVTKGEDTEELGYGKDGWCLKVILGAEAPLEGGCGSVKPAGFTGKRWLMRPDGLVESRLKPNKCLDITGGSKTPGSPVGLYTCDATNEGQRWTQVSVANVTHQGVRVRRDTPAGCTAPAPVDVDDKVYRPLSAPSAQLPGSGVVHGHGSFGKLSVFTGASPVPADASAVLINVRVSARNDVCLEFSDFTESFWSKVSRVWHNNPVNWMLCQLVLFEDGGRGPAGDACTKEKDNYATPANVAVQVPKGVPVDVQVVVPAAAVADGKIAEFAEARDGTPNSVHLTQTASVAGYYTDPTAAEESRRARREFYGWGDKVGDGTASARQTPTRVEVLQGEMAPAAVAGGAGNSMALVDSGDVYTWGDNDEGQLGDGGGSGGFDPEARPRNPLIPTRVSNVRGVTAIAAGMQSDYALSGTGVWAWGDNSQGQLCAGNSVGASSSRPVRVTFPAGFSGRALAIASRGETLYVMDEAHVVWSCGSNTGGALCNAQAGPSSSRLVRAAYLRPADQAGVTPVELVAGTDSLYVRLSNGKVAACGSWTHLEPPTEPGGSVGFETMGGAVGQLVEDGNGDLDGVQELAVGKASNLVVRGNSRQVQSEGHQLVSGRPAHWMQSYDSLLWRADVLPLAQASTVALNSTDTAGFAIKDGWLWAWGTQAESGLGSRQPVYPATEPWKSPGQIVFPGDTSASGGRLKVSLVAAGAQVAYAVGVRPLSHDETR